MKRRLIEWLASGRAPSGKPHSCSVPLSHAMVCLDCWQVGLVGSRCSTCGSTGCMMLNNWLVTK